MTCLPERSVRRAMARPSRRALAVAPVMAACLLQGCVVGPHYDPPQTAAPAAFKEQGAQRQTNRVIWNAANPQDGAPRGRWWKVYNEPELDALEDKLEVSDQNIVQAYQNFEAARAVVRQAQAAYYPTVSIGPQFSRSGTKASDVTTKQYSFPIDVSWEPDIWGKVRNTVRADKAAAQVSAADLANERLSEEASLAEDYFELRGQDALIALYRRTIDAYSKNLVLTQTLLQAGIDDGQSYAQAELNLKNAQAAATNLGVSRAEYEHAIALLVGQSASSFSMSARPLTTSAPAIDPGIPSELLERRPDIAAAERTLAEANAQIGVQVAALYPSLSLTGEGGSESSQLSSLLSAPSLFYTVGASAVQTIFDGGLRRAQVRQAKAQYQADLAAYRNTVLTAFQQTEDGLSTNRLLTIQLGQQLSAIAAASHYYDLARSRFQTGVDTYLNVFTAEAALLSDQQTLITLEVQQMINSVQLVKALGGGWHVAKLADGSAGLRR